MTAQNTKLTSTSFSSSLSLRGSLLHFSVSLLLLMSFLLSFYISLCLPLCQSLSPLLSFPISFFFILPPPPSPHLSFSSLYPPNPSCHFRSSPLSWHHNTARGKAAIAPPSDLTVSTAPMGAVPPPADLQRTSGKLTLRRPLLHRETTTVYCSYVSRSQ